MDHAQPKERRQQTFANHQATCVGKACVHAALPDALRPPGGRCAGTPEDLELPHQMSICRRAAPGASETLTVWSQNQPAVALPRTAHAMPRQQAECDVMHTLRQLWFCAHMWTARRTCGRKCMRNQRAGPAGVRSWGTSDSADRHIVNAPAPASTHNPSTRHDIKARLIGAGVWLALEGLFAEGSSMPISAYRGVQGIRADGPGQQVEDPPWRLRSAVT